MARKSQTVILNVTLSPSQSREFFTKSRKKALRRGARKAGKATRKYGGKFLRWTGRATGRGLSAAGKRLQKL
jgi:hypothetical protein